MVRLSMPMQIPYFAVKASHFDQSENHHAASRFAVQHSMLLSLPWYRLILVAFTGCNVLVSDGVGMHRKKTHWKNTA